MGYDRGDSFPSDFQPNGIPFGLENRKETRHHDHIPFNLTGTGNTVFSDSRRCRPSYWAMFDYSRQVQLLKRRPSGGVEVKAVPYARQAFHSLLPFKDEELIFHDKEVK